MRKETYKRHAALKARLIMLAESGPDRPYWRSRDSRWLSRYTSPSTYGFDAAFAKMIFGIRPDWKPQPSSMALLPQIEKLREEGLSASEVGDHLGVTRNVVLGVMYRARHAGAAI